MRKTFIAIAAVIIASASIFLACSKDSENEEAKKVNNEPIAINKQDIILGSLQKDQATGQLSISPNFDTKKSMSVLENILNKKKGSNASTIVENIGFYVYEDSVNYAVIPLLQVGLFYVNDNNFENIFIELQKIETSDKVASNYFGVSGDIVYSCTCSPDQYCNEGAPNGGQGCYPYKNGSQWDCTPCYSRRGVCRKSFTATETLEAISQCIQLIHN